MAEEFIPLSDLSKSPFRKRDESESSSLATLSREDDLEQIDLSIGGMTCSSCVARVEGSLNKFPGASATVNFATESAHVLVPKGTKVKALIERVESVGYQATLRKDENESFSRSRALGIRTLLAAFFAIPAIVLSMTMSLHEPVDSFIHQILDQFKLLHPTYSAHGWLVIGLTTPIVLFIAWPIHRAGFRNLLHPTMDTLVSLGSLSAFGWSIYANSTGAGDIYAEVAAGVLLFIILGRYFESRAKHRAGSALAGLLAMGAKEVTILRGNEEVIAPIENLQVGHRFVLRPGDRVPADGIVVSGKGSIDNSHITGESIPVEVGAGSEVVSGAINLTTRLVVEAQRVGRDSELSRITQMVLTAQSEKAPVQQMADRISAVFVPIVVTASLATFIVWYGFDFGTLQQAVTAAVSLLVIACPCALGLATPVALLVASGSGARKGIVLRKVRAIEIASSIDTVIFDKTGTLTTGKMTVQKTVMSSHNLPLGEVLAASYAISKASNHPVATAIARYSLATLGSEGLDAEGGKLSPKKLVDFTESAGAGLAARLSIRSSDSQMNDLPVLLGSPSSIAKATLSLPREIAVAVDEARMRGNSISILAIDGASILAFEVGDSLRSDAKETIQSLDKKGIQTWLISGDSHEAVSTIASTVGIDPSRTIAEATPAAKISKIKALKAEGHRVLMIGDGVNDAAALAEADLSMAMGTGTDTAIATADITLVRPELGAAKDALNLSARTLRTIRGNLGWAFIYNVIGIPIAALGLLNPMIAGAAMATSSLFVVMNSLRLRRVLN